LLSWVTISRAQVPVAVPEPGAIDVVAPGLTWSAGDQFLWDDNVFRLPHGYAVPAYLERGASHEDHVNSASVNAEGNWTIGLQNVDVMARIVHNTYANYSFLDNNSRLVRVYWDWRAGRFSGRIGANDDCELINFGYSRLFAKDMVDSYNYYASGRYQLGPRWTVTGSATRSATNHSLASYASSDGTSSAGSLGAEYSTSPESTVELQYKYTNGGYPEATTIAARTAGGFHDDTTRVLLHYAPGDATLILANAGYLQRSYAAGGLKAYSGDIWHVSVRWDPASHTEIEVAAGRDLQSYVDAVNEYFVDDERSVIVSWKPRDYLGVSLVLAWQKEDYIPNTDATANGFARKDSLNDQKVTVSSAVRRWLSLSASAGLEQRTSNDRSFVYDDKIVSASFKVTF
jgi:hypothetical protein